MWLLLVAVPAASALVYPAGVQAAISGYGMNVRCRARALVFLKRASARPHLPPLAPPRGRQYLVQTLVPSLIAKVGTINVPDVNGNQDGFDYSLHSIECHGLAVGGEGVALSPPSTIGVTLSGVTLTCSAGWHFNLHSWPHFPDGSGTADVSVSQGVVSVGAALNASALRPSLLCTAASLAIGRVDITLHGSALDWLLNLFKSQLEGAIRSALDKSLPPVVAAFVDQDGNAFLGALPIAVPVPARAPYNVSQARFGFVAAPSTAGAYLGLAVQGDVTPLGFAGVPPVAPPALPPPFAGDSGFMVVGRFSPYTLLSAAWTFYSAGLFSWAVPPAGVPLGLNATSAYALIAPGLPKAFPEGTVALGIALSGLPALAIAPGGINASAPLNISFLVTPAGGGGAQEAFTLAVAGAFSLAVAVEPSPSAPGSLVFAGRLQYLAAGVALADTRVGPVAVRLLQGLVDLVLPLLVDSVNGDLEKGFPLPPIPGVRFANATQLALADGFAQLEANFTFAPPAEAAA